MIWQLKSNFICQNGIYCVLCRLPPTLTTIPPKFLPPEPIFSSIHLLQLQKGDTIYYLMTDGYPDQFGGEKGTKFKNKQVEELLVASSNKPLGEQKNILSQNFDEWKGSLEQVDDFTIIGIKL
ncbi:MAG: hypothetical protein ACYDEC_15620 [Bacteroidia bacterium]